MSKLTAAGRRALPRSDFGLPATRQYPMPDRDHAIAAKARAAHAEAVGHITKAQENRIDRKADRVIARDK